MFTKENASAYGKAGAVAKWSKPKLPPIPLPELPPLAPIGIADNYALRRVARVRMQIERLNDLLDAEDDPQKLDRLAAALERLSELERVLDGRPLPGSRKPTEEKPDRGRFGWVQPQVTSPCGVDTPSPSVTPTQEPDFSV